MKEHHSGRVGQTLIYTGKLFRMFVFQNDWKVIPMAAIIAGLVSFVVGGTLFKTMEGTLRGTFALSCICIWNGFFNSIQSICRERPIVKREHRSGLHMSSYVAAHMIYQAFLCLCQTVVVIIILNVARVSIPTASYVTGSALIDVAITLFLTTYAADLMAMFVSAVVKNTTTAMTVMPFLMIFQLIFSGGFFQLEGAAYSLTNLTVSKWGLTALCAEGEYNSLPNGALLTAFSKMDLTPLVVSITGETVVEADTGEKAPLSDESATQAMQDVTTSLTNIGEDEFSINKIKEKLNDEETRNLIMKKCGDMSYEPKYESSTGNIVFCWICMIGSALLFAGMTVISLEFIDKDKR